eukprot:5305532-Pyramimonas_sp.AAC.2
MPASSGLDGAGTASSWPSPVGLSLGILSVIIGQIVVICYMYAMRARGCLKPVQLAGAQQYRFREALATHVSEVGGLLLLGFYLCATWMFNLMPASYYSFEGGVQPLMVLMQLISQDFIQTFMHYGEHKIHPYLYKISHKPHHRYSAEFRHELFVFQPLTKILRPCEKSIMALSLTKGRNRKRKRGTTPQWLPLSVIQAWTTRAPAERIIGPFIDSSLVISSWK